MGNHFANKDTRNLFHERKLLEKSVKTMSDQSRNAYLAAEINDLDNYEFFDLLKKVERTARLDYEKFQELFLTLDSATTLHYRVTSAKREPSTVTWIESLAPDAVFFDIGANVGAYSLIAASQKNVVRAFAFEPHYANFHSLKRNISINGFGEKIVALNIALSHASGLGPFQHWDDYEAFEVGSSGHQFGESITEDGHAFDPVYTETIMALSIDDICKMIGVVPTDIKVDVDGIELELLKGGFTTLANPEVRSVMVECNIGTDGITSLMKDAGFMVGSISEHNNILFVRQ